MAANPDKIQELAATPKFKPLWGTRGPALQTHKQIRRAMADVIRGMGRGDIDFSAGRTIIRSMRELHGMLIDESTATHPGSSLTQNLLLVAGELSPALRLVSELRGSSGSGTETGLARLVQDRPVLSADDGAGPT